jgi:hypothetical protein
LNNLRNLFLQEGAECTLDVQKASELMIEYAQTLPTKWLKLRVKFVSRRLTDLAAKGRLGSRDMRFKEVLLNLLVVANAGNDAKVAEIFGEAASAYPSDLQSFWLYLVNWLADKVVDTWPPLPNELKKEPREASKTKVRPSERSTVASPEEWLPAKEAVERAEKSGLPVGLKWLTQDAHKHGVRIRLRQQPGRPSPAFIPRPCGARESCALCRPLFPAMQRGVVKQFLYHCCAMVVLRRFRAGRFPSNAPSQRGMNRRHVG